MAKTISWQASERKLVTVMPSTFWFNQPGLRIY
jgi:hypothetical protein